MSNSKAFFTALVYMGLRAGVILFSAALLFDFGKDPGFYDTVWNVLTQIIIGVLFLFILAICIFTGKSQFDVVGFLFVLLGSIFKILMIFIEQRQLLEIPIYFLLIAVALYFQTKNRRSQKKKTLAFYHE